MRMDIQALRIPDVKLLVPKRFFDSRGFFAELYNKRAFAELGIDCEFVQDNHSFSSARGTMRGLHFQIAPFAQTKLVRVVRGAIFDVAVDLRQGSPSYGQHVSSVLSAENGKQMFVPCGFAHGFMTLEPNTEVAYKVSEFFSLDYDRGLLWDDPELGIDWPFEGREAVFSDKDRTWPHFREMSKIAKFD